MLPVISVSFNSFMTEVVIIYKPVCWFANLLCKSVDRFLCDNGLRHERVNKLIFILTSCRKILNWVFLIYQGSLQVQIRIINWHFYQPIPGKCFNFIHPENTRKSKVFWYLQGVENGHILNGYNRFWNSFFELLFFFISMMVVLLD